MSIGMEVFEAWGPRAESLGTDAWPVDCPCGGLGAGPKPCSERCVTPIARLSGIVLACSSARRVPCSMLTAFEWSLGI